MKRLIAFSSILLLLVGCGGESHSEKEKKTKQEGTMQMARHKTDSGLEYDILTEGTGPEPKAGQEVSVHYTGWLNDNDKPGTKFDSSIDRGEPLAFKVGVGYVIPGWDEGVMMMKVGEKRRLFIPADLAYGARGVGNIIGPNANLIFDVELLEVK